MNQKLRPILTVLLAFLLLPISAQEHNDTVYTFHFVPSRDMFYVPFGDNDAELTRLEKHVEQYKAKILNGEMPLYVEGYSTSGKGQADNLAIAKIRSNRVKSELIIRQQLTEECFVTQNHSGNGDYVTVRIVVTANEEDAEKERRATALAEQQRIEQNRIAAEKAHADSLAVEKEKQKQLAAERERRAAEQAQKAKQAQANSIAATQPHEEESTPNMRDESPAKPYDGYTLALRANLLRWATLTPDLGIEWRIGPSIGIMVNGSWTSWTWDDNNRRYALWEVAPEVRWYLGETKRWYVGAMYKAGQFNYKLCDTGRQGNLMGGGITGGYQLRLNNALSMDFTLGVGYLHADYDKYIVVDKVRVRHGSETKHWIVPINAGVTLVWKIK